MAGRRLRSKLDAALRCGNDWFSQQLFNPLEPVIEDRFQRPPGPQRVNEATQRTQGHLVANAVGHQRSLRYRQEFVGVMPQLVWPLELHVAEAPRRLPGLD